ncbi:hypothetical protein ACIQJT_41055 [Streptomyces sp. NPDC091972]|uniref:hypothetical protein n=1 Tax=Streptomyces sp. NPDC091972 TaxID=3366007 RepID=UPI00380EBA1F
MNVITCAFCTSEAATFRVRPDRVFECPQGHEITVRDICLDEMNVWAVDASGTLGYVVSPVFSLEVIAEALEDLANCDSWPHPEYAARVALDTAFKACVDYVAAYRVGVA